MKLSFLIAVTTLVFFSCSSTVYGTCSTDSVYDVIHVLQNECSILQGKIKKEENLGKPFFSSRQIQRFLNEVEEGKQDPDWLSELIVEKPLLVAEKPDTKIMPRTYLQLAQEYNRLKLLEYKLRSIAIQKATQQLHTGPSRQRYQKSVSLAEKQIEKYTDLVKVYEQTLKKCESEGESSESLAQWRASWSITNRKQDKSDVVNAMRKLRNQRIKLQKEIDEDKPKTREIVQTYKNEIEDNGHHRHWLSLSKEIGYNVEKLLNEPDRTFNHEEVQELAMELNHLKSAWYELRSSVLIREGDRLDSELEEAVEKATKLSEEHKSIYERQKMDLEHCWLVIDGSITEADSGQTHTTNEGHRIQSKVDMEEAIANFQYAIKKLIGRIEKQTAQKNLIVPITVRDYLLESDKRCLQMPARDVLYTPLELCRLRKEYPSIEFLQLARHYHKHEKLWYQLRNLVLDEVLQNFHQFPQINIIKLKDVINIANENTKYHKSLMEDFEKHLRDNYSERSQDENIMEHAGTITRSNPDSRLDVDTNETRSEPEKQSARVAVLKNHSSHSVDSRELVEEKANHPNQDVMAARVSDKEVLGSTMEASRSALSTITSFGQIIPVDTMTNTMQYDGNIVMQSFSSHDVNSAGADQQCETIQPLYSYNRDLPALDEFAEISFHKRKFDSGVCVGSSSIHDDNTCSPSNKILKYS